jgi:hypothetical protein
LVVAVTKIGYLKPSGLGTVVAYKPRRQSRFLKRHILSSDGHDFIGRIFDLSVVSLNFTSYEEVERYPDCKYALDVNFQMSTLVRRVESLNLVGDLLWLETPNGGAQNLPVSKYEWLVLSADVFLMRYVSVVDCASLLVNEVFECGLEAQKCSIGALKKLAVPVKTIEILELMQSEQGEIRRERNARFHHGREREFSSDDLTFRSASIYDHRAGGVSGTDQFGRKINIELFFREGLVELQKDFNSKCRILVRSLDKLYDSLLGEFEGRFKPKFRSAIHDFGTRRSE